jgi:hypothetical protein
MQSAVKFLGKSEGKNLEADLGGNSGGGLLPEATKNNILTCNRSTNGAN